MKEIFYFIMPWQPSDILVAGPSGAVSRLDFLRGHTEAELLAGFGAGYAVRKDPDFLPELQTQLRGYLRGDKVEWRVKLDLIHGTDFQRSVWHELQKIPYGRTATYGEIASRLGKPGAMRAVGSANGANPVAIIIPCHRVVAAHGGLGGYGGGLDVKRILLQLEGVTL
jgi:methylated-DNA-[protein]-cysteine S-methyltransferase